MCACSTAIEYLDGLRDPILVWRFQYYFGVRRRSNLRKCDESNGGPVRPVANSEPESDDIIKTCSRDVRIEPVTDIPCSTFPSAATTTTSDSDSSSSSSNGDAVVAGKVIKGRDQEIEITKPFWYNLFCVGAALGDEAFYSSFFPFWFWNVDGAVFRRVVMIWVLVMYIGQGLKDVVRWPRPSSPPVVRLEEKWALEYGMPSTHAMVGSAIPFSFLFYTMYRYEYPVILGLVICIVWCCLVCGSRLYLGMHSVLDIVVGLALAITLMTVALPFVDIIDAYVLSSTASPLYVLLCHVILIYIYPETTVKVTRGDTVTILGVGAGVAWGSWLNFQLGIIRGPPLPPPYRILWPTYEMAGLTLLRTCIGIAIVVATRAAFKSFTYALACHVMRLDPRDATVSRRRVIVELSSTFITYAAVAFNITYLSPTVFRFLNIERLTMFTEV